MRQFSASPVEMVASFWRNRQLILQMSKREAIGRYRGSVMGLAWSFFNPLLMLVIYTFVFSVVFKARWGLGADESKTDFAIILFVGLIVHGLFAECVNRAPGLIITNVNYVKKVVFPLEILPWIAFGSALFHAIISLIVLLLAKVVLNQHIPLTAVLLPLVLTPLVFGIMGMAWFLAALGVYLRDVSQVAGLFTTAMLFISAVFFPITALPERFQFWLQFNPLAVIIEQSRSVLIFGQLPNLISWSAMMGLGLVMAWVGFAWFQKTRKGFADVL
ncbi:MAG: Teichoic acid translocation permease protein TagG [Dehalococcoidia bacterium]|nr:Teichoic acid translocation permease protein TagG [Chloroflexota bacterium]MBT9161785.1 Teichoic acid translocation permease protein TagG [Chloroflexota bacterium]